MNTEAITIFEERLRQVAGVFPYPATPDIASGVAIEARTGRKQSVFTGWKQLAYAFVIVLVLLGVGLAVPPVRAQILEFLQIGAVRIFLVEPTPTATPPPPSQTPSTMEEPTQADILTAPDFRMTPTPVPTVFPTSPSSLDLYGATTLDMAREMFPYPVRLPEYPSELGQPDQVFLQDTGGESLILVWLDPENRSKVNLSLQLIVGTQNIAMEKIQPRVVQETEVNGQPAVWAEGPYMVKVRNGEYESTQLINGHVLIWAEDEITYRLETDLPLEEAIRIAESLQ